MKKLILLLQAFLMSAVMMAVPARPGAFKVTQKDGTVLTVRLVGDEHLSYFVNEADGQKMYRAEDGDLKPLTEQRFMLMKSRGQERRAMIEKVRAERLTANRKAVSKAGGPNKVGEVGGGMTGSKKGIVILVNFQDVQFIKTQQDFYNQFNQVGYNKNNHLGSVHDYFYDQSYGNFDLDFDVVGPVTVSKSMAYYGAKSGNDNDSYPATMVREACQLVNDQVDFSNYDWDGDGYVDQVFVIYAGYGEAQGASSNTIWPHEWQLSSASWYGDGQGRLYVDGVVVDTYACSCELTGYSGTTMDGIGTACHEFSHCLGYPDLYDIDYSGGWGMGPWDLMCSGSYNGYNGRGEVPAGYTSYERWLAGWLEPTVLEEGKTVTDMAPLNDTPEAYIIYNDKNSDEFIMLENRKSEKWFKYVSSRYSSDAYGLLAIHVDYDAGVWAQNGPNNDPNHQRVTIIPANRSYGNSNYHLQVFAGSSTYNGLTQTSHANCGGKWWTACSTGSRTFNHELSDIVYNRFDKTMSFLFDGGDAVDDGTRYKVTYDAGSGTADMETWTQTEWREEAVMPSATGSREGYEFIGWSKTKLAKTTSQPTALLLPGDKLKLDADITLYAVYKYYYVPGNTYYTHVTSLSKDRDYLFLSSKTGGEAYAIDKESETFSSPVQVKTVNNQQIVSKAAGSSVWTCNYSSGSIRRLINGSDYLSITSSGLGTVASGFNLMWSSTSGLYATVGVTKYYVHPGEDGAFVVDKNTGNPVYAFELVGEKAKNYYANSLNYYQITYMVGDEVYDQYDIEAGTGIVPIADPEAPEGYTFAGWDGLPEVMPAEDVVVTARFDIGKYLAVFVVDGDTIQSDSIAMGDPIVVPEDPVKEGHAFTGWDPEVDEVMPGHDVTYEALFDVNKYLATFVADGDTIQSDSIAFGDPIVAPLDPEKEGYTFKGWSPEVDEVMPARDVTYEALFDVNKYLVTFVVEGDTIQSDSIAFGASIVLPTETPEKEGYTFVGWDPEVDEVVPAHDVTYEAVFTVNSYLLTYLVDGEVYKSDSIQFGATIVPEEAPVKEDYEFSGWSEIPETMPAHDVEVTGIFTVSPTAIESVVAAIRGRRVQVYNMQGAMIKANATADDLRGLPRGLYIIEGRKVVK